MTLYLIQTVPPAPPPLRAELGRLIDQYGPARLTGALLVALATRKGRGQTICPADLGAHLRRDVGLPPHDGRRDYWRHL